MGRRFAALLRAGSGWLLHVLMRLLLLLLLLLVMMSGLMGLLLLLMTRWGGGEWVRGAGHRGLRIRGLAAGGRCSNELSGRTGTMAARAAIPVTTVSHVNGNRRGYLGWTAAPACRPTTGPYVSSLNRRPVRGRVRRRHDPARYLSRLQHTMWVSHE